MTFLLNYLLYYYLTPLSRRNKMLEWGSHNTDPVMVFIKFFIAIAILKFVMSIGKKLKKNKMSINHYIEKIPVEYNGRKGYIRSKKLSKVSIDFCINWENTFGFVFDDDTQKVVTSFQELNVLKQNGMVKKGKTSLFVFHQSDVEYE